MAVPELAVAQLRCPGCGATGFVQEVEGGTTLTEWLFDCSDCVRRYRIELLPIPTRRDRGAPRG